MQPFFLFYCYKSRGIFFRGQSYHISFQKVLLIHLGSIIILWRIVTTIFIVAFKFCMFCPFFTAPFSFYWVFFFSFLLLTLAFRYLHGILLHLLTLAKNPSDCWTQIRHTDGPIHTRKGLSGWLTCLMSSMKTFQIFLTIEGGLGFQPLSSLLHPEGVCDLKLWHPSLSPHSTPSPPSYIGISSCKIFVLLICKLHLFLGLNNTYSLS